MVAKNRLEIFVELEFPPQSGGIGGRRMKTQALVRTEGPQVPVIVVVVVVVVVVVLPLCYRCAVGVQLCCRCAAVVRPLCCRCAVTVLLL